MSCSNFLLIESALYHAPAAWIVTSEFVVPTRLWLPGSSRIRLKRARNAMRASGLVYPRETTMPKSNREPSTAETGEQLPARPHDSGSQANETVDGLDTTAEALRHAAEDTPTGTGPDDVEKTPVFDRAGLAPKI